MALSITNSVELSLNKFNKFKSADNVVGFLKISIRSYYK